MVKKLRYYSFVASNNKSILNKVIDTLGQSKINNNFVSIAKSSTWFTCMEIYDEPTNKTHSEYDSPEEFYCKIIGTYQGIIKDGLNTDTYLKLAPDHIGTGKCQPFVEFTYNFLFNELKIDVYQLFVTASDNNFAASKCYINAARKIGLHIYDCSFNILDAPEYCNNKVQCVYLLINKNIDMNNVKKYLKFCSTENLLEN